MRSNIQTNIFAGINPRTGSETGRYREASSEEVRSVAEAAERAGESAAFAERDRRSRLLCKAASGLRDCASEIVSCAEVETALPQARLTGELERTAKQLEMFAEVVIRGDYLQALIDLPDPEAKPIPRPDLRRMLIPVGPVAVFEASNFPLAFGVAGGDAASALAAGCPAIVKGHPSHPGTSELIAKVLHRAASGTGLPEGVFALLQSAGASVGEELVDQPQIAAVAFTGSLAAGRALFDRAARRPVPIPVYAEMGSVNPFIVTRGALDVRGEAIADGLAESIVGSAGQLCTKPGLVFVPAADAGEAFVTFLGRRLADAGPQWLLNERVRDGLMERTAVLCELAEPVGPQTPPSYRDDVGFTMQPQLFRTSLAGLRASPQIAEECFGPVVVLATYDDLDQLPAALRGLGGQLTATIHSELCEAPQIAPLLATLTRIAGRLVFDGYPTGVSVTPAMQHGGPYPASTAAAHTSVGMAAISRFLRPVAWQNCPPDLLPSELRDKNP
jgi:acyl-CoA reductase-like NAD-dependent aldehyde dehydrogenase